MQPIRPRAFRVRLRELLRAVSVPDTPDPNDPSHASLIARAVRKENQRLQELHYQRCPKVARVN